MKVAIARGELYEALSIVSKGLSARTTLPILSGVHVAAHGETIVLQATDLEVSIRHTLKAGVATEGQTVLPGRLLGDIVRNLPEAAVTIETDSRGGARVTCEQSTFDMRTQNPEDYPKFPELQTDDRVSIPAVSLAELVRQTGRAASRDETRPILTGILFNLQHGKLTMAATDSYRLAVREEELEGVETVELDVVVPGKALEDVARLAQGSETVSMGVAENQIVFEIGETLFVTRRIEGTFPNWRQLVPAEFETRVTCDTQTLLDAVKRVSLMAQHSVPLRLSVEPDERVLRLSATTQDIGGASEDVEVDVEGPAVEMAFNHAYLIDGITATDVERVALEFTSPLKPGVVRPVDGPVFTYLLMPVRLG